MKPTGMILLGVVACAGRESVPQGDVPVGQMLLAATELGLPVELRIDAIDPDPNDRDGELELYTISVRQGDGWTNYCKPDAFGMAKAVMLNGSWDARGDFTPSSKVTVACTAGPLGKCARLGYKPWKTVDGRSLAEFHQACVRMMRADYCGDGRPHTIDGTFIDLYDRLGIQQSDPEGADMEFEAGWGPNGATYINTARWTREVQDIVAECPAKLATRVAFGARTAADVMREVPDTLLVNEHAANAADKMRRPAEFPAPER